MRMNNIGFMPAGVRRIARRFLPGVAALLLAACTTFGPAYQPPPPPDDGYATIVIYREQNTHRNNLPDNWYVDERQAISIYGNGYAAFQVRAGVHRLNSDGKFASGALKVHTRFEAGRTYFFKIEIAQRGGVTLSSITGIQPPFAHEDLKGYRMSEPLRTKFE